MPNVAASEDAGSSKIGSTDTGLFTPPCITNREFG